MRLRIDQAIRINWMFLLPAALVEPPRRRLLGRAEIAVPTLGTIVFGTLRTMRMTLRNVFRAANTVPYPRQKRPIPGQWRAGSFALDLRSANRRGELHRLPPVRVHLPVRDHHGHAEEGRGPEERNRRHLLRRVRPGLPGVHAVRAVHPGLSDGRDRHDPRAGTRGDDARRPAPDEGAPDGERPAALAEPTLELAGDADGRSASGPMPRAGSQTGERLVRDLAFYALAVCLLAAAVAVVTAKSLFRAAFALSGALVTTAGLYLLPDRSAPGRRADPPLHRRRPDPRRVRARRRGREHGRRALAQAGSGGARWRSPCSSRWPPPCARLPGGLAAGGAREREGRRARCSFDDYLVPFELLSVLLLGAVFGALLAGTQGPAGMTLANLLLVAVRGLRDRRCTASWRGGTRSACCSRSS